MLVLYHTQTREVAHMKKTYLKKLLVACVATFAMTGMQFSTVEAITLDTEHANNIHQQNLQNHKDTKKKKSEIISSLATKIMTKRNRSKRGK